MPVGASKVRGVKNGAGRISKGPKTSARSPRNGGIGKVVQSNAATKNAANAFYLMKSEVDVFSIDDLKSREKQTEPWDGVRNHQAKKIMQGMEIGDLAFFWASNTKEPGIVGIVKVVKEAYPDETQFDPGSPYYDSKSTRDAPRWFCVDVQLVEKFEQPVRLALLKQHADKLGHMPLFTMKRLSVQCVPSDAWEYICKLRADKLES